MPDVLAAVDLGSNSFHMVVARYSHGQLIIIDRLREMVRLAAGVEENGRIDKEVAARTVDVFGKFTWPKDRYPGELPLQATLLVNGKEVPGVKAVTRASVCSATPAEKSAR